MILRYVIILHLCLEDEPTYCTQRVVRSDFGNESDEEETYNSPSKTR